MGFLGCDDKNDVGSPHGESTGNRTRDATTQLTRGNMSVCRLEAWLLLLSATNVEAPTFPGVDGLIGVLLQAAVWDLCQ